MLAPERASRDTTRWAQVRAACAALGLVMLVGTAHAEDDVVEAGVLLRADTDTTQVISPRARTRLGLLDEDTHFDVEYTADVWTSASIDIRTAATAAVTEQRDELNAGLDRRFEDSLVRGAYRFSIENDYESHGGVLSFSQDMADHNTTFELLARAQYDAIGRSGDDLFRREQAVVGVRASLTQVIDPNMIVQGAYEIIHAAGYQASPYRFVGIGGDGLCGGSAQLCVPETVPTARTRHAIVVRARRAFDDHVSLHLDYRFYADDWNLIGNTAAAQINWLPDERSLFAFRYRMHTQTAASFYRSRYPEPSGTLGFVTRDKELSPLWSHRVAISYERDVDLAEAGPRLRVAAALGGTYFDYQDFVGLSEVLAVDLTLTLGVEL